MSNSNNVQNDTRPYGLEIQNDSPYTPFYKLESFYTELLQPTFETSFDAVLFCKQLSSKYGFCVKKEQNTLTNIYLYCSREGLSDSNKNPKPEPRRNRQSQRCECLWRVGLAERDKNEGWKFRQHQNQMSTVHNHPLLKPEEIKKDWPPEVYDKIVELVRQRLGTTQIKQIIYNLFPNISQNDRRLYNRLSDERKKINQRDAEIATARIANKSAQLCMASAGSADLINYIESKLTALLEDACKITNVDINSLSLPLIAPLPLDPFNTAPTVSEERATAISVSSYPAPQGEESGSEINKSPNQSRSGSRRSSGAFEAENQSNTAPKSDEDPSESAKSSSKGHLSYFAVTIPEHTVQVRHNKKTSLGEIRRALFQLENSQGTANNHLQYTSQQPEMTLQHGRELSRRRSRALFAPDENSDPMDVGTPPRKLSRQVTSIIMDDGLDELSPQHSPSNSQNVMFTPDVNTGHDMGNIEPHRQLLQYNSNQLQVNPSVVAASDSTLFYNAGSSSKNHRDSDGGGNNSNIPIENNATNNPNSNTDSSYMHQSSYPTTPTAMAIGENSSNNLYPPGNINVQARHQHHIQHSIYDPNTYIQHQQQHESFGLLPAQGSAQHQMQENAHAMSFRPGIPNLPMKSNALPMSRVPIAEHPHQTALRPLGYSSGLSELETMMEENNAKQRCYPNYRDSPMVPASPVTPTRPTTLHSSRPSSQNIIPQQQQLQTHYMLSQPNQQVFTSFPQQLEHSPNQQVYSNPYIAAEQMLSQQQKGKQLQQQYNFNRQQQQQQQRQGYEAHQREQQQQYLNRRFSGPN